MRVLINLRNLLKLSLVLFSGRLFLFQHETTSFDWYFKYLCPFGIYPFAFFSNIRSKNIHNIFGHIILLYLLFIDVTYYISHCFVISLHKNQYLLPIPHNPSFFTTIRNILSKKKIIVKRKNAQCGSQLSRLHIPQRLLSPSMTTIRSM